MQFKRLYHSVRLALTGSYTKRAEYLKKHGVLAGMGEKCQWGPTVLPPYAELIKLHDNVHIHKTAKLIPHDVLNMFLKKAYPQGDFGYYERLGCIEIMDNVYVSMNSVILPNVRINRNCIVSAGSVVANDVPENSVVAGNPAHVIGTFDQYVAARMLGRDKNMRFKHQNLSDAEKDELWKSFELVHKAKPAKREQQKDDPTREEFPANSSEAGRESVPAPLRAEIMGILAEAAPHVDFLSSDRLIDDGILDSLSIISIVSALSEQYDIEFDLDELEPKNLNSVDAITETVQKLLG